MDTLSEELVLRILQHLRNSSIANDLLPCLLVCRRLHRIGTPILYHDVLVRNPSLCTSKVSLRTHSHQVRSLSIRIRPCETEMYRTTKPPHYLQPVDPTGDLRDKGSAATHALWEALDAFAADVIPILQNLSTFSLTLDTWYEGPQPHGFWIRRSSSALMIRNLPHSVQNLEVDLELYEQPLTDNDPSSSHSCPSLRRLLPGLRHLRLRLASLCPALFYDFGDDEDDHEVIDDGIKPVRAQHLETLVLNTSDGRFRTYACSRHDPHLQYHYRSMGASPEISTWWTSICLQALHAGSFPKVLRFDVFAFKWDDYYPEEHEDDEVDEDTLSQSALCSDLHIQYCILARKTYHLPQRYVAQHPRGTMLRTRTHEEVFGDPPVLEQKAEGPAWVETVAGMRFPAAFAAMRREDQGYVWRELELQGSREEFIRDHNFGLEVWDEEEKVGHWIMDVEEVDGVVTSN